MLRAVLPMVTVLGLALLPYPGQAASITTLKSLKLDVPTSDTMFPAGPGSDAINNNCLACHSADHVLNTAQISRGKIDRLHRAPAEFTTPVVDDCGLRDHLLARPVGLVIRFLSIGSRLCSTLPSDPTSR